MFDGWWKKLTTKPIWYYERHRLYPLRQASKQLPALESAQHDSLLAVLTTADTFVDALWSGWSWFRYLQSDLSLCFFMDGPVNQKQRAIVNKLFPGASITNLHDIAGSRLFSGENLRRFIDHYALGQKAALIMSLQEKYSVFYSDFDVLAFNTPQEVMQIIKSGGRRIAFNQQSGDGSFDQQIVKQARKLNLQPPLGFNAGLMWIPQNSIDLHLADELLGDWSPQTTHGWFSEQTLFAILANHAGCQALPPKRYVVDTQRQFYWQDDVDYQKIAARHFIYPVRHVMYLKGQPIIHEQSRHYPPSGG